MSDTLGFVVKHYHTDEHPSIKGNGFDGLQLVCTREEAEEFIAWINARIIDADVVIERCAKICDDIADITDPDDFALDAARDCAAAIRRFKA